MVILIVAGALGMVSQSLEKRPVELKLRGRIPII